MKTRELFRLVWLNITQNKFKTILTSIGIIVGAATIVMVFAIGEGGQADVADQFKNLNAGAIDISYAGEKTETSQGSGTSGEDGENLPDMPGGTEEGEMPEWDSSEMPEGGFPDGMPGSDGDGETSGGFPGNMQGDGEASGMPEGGFPGGDGESSGGFPGGDGEMSGGFPGGDSDSMPQMPEGGTSGDGGSFPGGMPGSSSDGENGGDFSGGMPGSSSDGEAGGFSGGMRGNGDSSSMPDMSGGSFSGGRGDFSGGGGGFSGGMMGGFSGGMMGGFFGGGFGNSSSSNQNVVTLTEDDVEEIETFVSGITVATISYSTKTQVEGGDLEEAETYTVAGVKPEYETVSNLTLAMGEFITDTDNENKEKVCVLGATVAEEMFGSAMEAYGSIISIDSRSYVVNGVLETMGTVASGISPDEAVFIPYSTGVKYIVGTRANPTVTVLAADVEQVDAVIEELTALLDESYPEAEFSFEDAGSKMEAASASNEILTMLLMAMAAIVFVVGGIGIMNVLFVSVKERTGEIGILKAIGCSRKNILMEFLLEAAAISLIGGILGVALSIGIAPIVEYFGVRVELSVSAAFLALVFAVITGTIFGFYPAFKASRLVPVEALGAE